jgi:hypothetical protein
VKARALIGGASFPPDVLRVLYEAFDDAWGELAADVSTHASVVEACRLSLATIVLSLASAGTIERDALKNAAIDAFRRKHP